ncbi:MAG: hypothetical protein IT457_19180 [Planctomycetes bacterium]|nr:hypothetical protein [Planctomycetota bacterium]
MLRPLALTILALVAVSSTLPAQEQGVRGDEGRCTARRHVAQAVRNPARRHVGVRLRLRRVMLAESATITPIVNTKRCAAPSFPCHVAAPGS